MPPPYCDASSEAWASVVARIREGDSAGVEELYGYFAQGVRLLLFRQLGPEHLDDRVHDVFLVVLEAIRDGSLREPERLLGFIRTVVRRHTVSAIHHVVDARRDALELDVQWNVADHADDPEESVIQAERVELIQRTLAEMTPRDREILTRFYLHEESAEQICEQMGLNETQFRLLKSRAKARFGETGRRRVQNANLRGIFLRKIASA
ncbi:MAG TPA: sigma-70 family RNA polymerase sigma factor [Bryobacteraceae bacterium]|nr:sigma-70 family RNA polymerase sigma factor [Bryobacteraceae bacterium]